MTTPLPVPEQALQQFVEAIRTHAAKHVGTVPLRDADLRELLRVIVNSPQLRRKVSELQQLHIEQWFEILHGSARTNDAKIDDRRFSSPEWHTIPWFDQLRRLYLLNTQFLEGFITLLASEASLEASSKRRIAFSCRQLIDAMSPANCPGTNPLALKQAFKSHGNSLVQGADNLAKDVARGQITMSDEAAFEIGRNIATTPGDIVFENELIQLIQYRATTAQVHARPLLIVPPFINKYYILDLQESNSFVKYCIDSNLTTFVISWRNIPAELGHLTWEDYVDKGVLDAIKAVRSICRSEPINTLGFCVGGTLLATALATQGSEKRKQLGSLTLLASMLDFSDTGEISVFIDEEYVQQCEQDFARGGVMLGSKISSSFSSLRANELVWHFFEKNYLLGKAPQVFDLLYWNSDSSNLSGPLYAYYLRNMYLENRLRIPGELTLRGVPVDLGAIVAPAMIVATRDDHIVPWQSAYRSATLLGGDKRFVLGASGHIAGVINPASANRRKYWIAENDAMPADAQTWESSAQEVAGSWWVEWMRWLNPLAGEQRTAPLKTGNKRYPPLEAAPGRYVRERNDNAVRSNPTEFTS